MFNFTHGTDKSDGQFNGRFAFRAPHNSPRVSPSELRSIANAAPDALADEAIRHEFLHWRVFQSSDVGRSLIGKRYRTRAQFLRGNLDAVRAYYTQRSSYFCESFATHENIVKSLEKRLGDTPSIQALSAIRLSADDIKEVVDADESALTLCGLCGVPYSLAQRRLDSILGHLGTREFGLQAYVDLGGQKLALNEVSLKGMTHGIFNAATETAYSNAPPHIRVIRKLVRYGNAERWFGALDSRKLAMWAYLKLNTEITLLGNSGFSKVLETRQGSIEAYFKDNVNFIVAYTGANYGALAKGLIVEALLDCGDPTIRLEDAVERLANIDPEFIYFFYAHGN